MGTGLLRAQVVINEVLANEPGSTTGLEWIELYSSGTSVSLGDYSLRIGDDLILLPADISLSEDEYFIICRRLFATSTSPGFESYWGDSSGIWGDTPYEASLQKPFEVAMSLTNDTGCADLLWGSTIASTFTWDRSGLDGYSWERVECDGDSIAQSIDPSGSTPGFVNSVTPVSYDLALTSVTVETNAGVTRLTFEISNVGREMVNQAELYVIDIEDVPPDTFDVIQLESIEVGETLIVDQEYVLNGMYIPMAGALSADDREANNSREFMSVGQDYPPLVLSEFLANPVGDLASEWVEIRNRSDQDIDLSQWQTGDILRLNSICNDETFLEAGDYVVVAQGSSAFLDFYTEFHSLCLEPGSWASLNNDADMVRLVDSYGIEADRFEYEAVYDANYTWCRVEDVLYPAQWGRSENSGGSPGEPNNVVLPHETENMSVTVEPPYVSPDGDGFEDFTTITISAPFADSYTVRVYDRQGRVVKRFFEEESMIPSEIQWNGLSDGGHRLPIGIYIVYVEASGVESVKKPVVIAR
ncbi:MAG: lamin tail domain-containing protein [Candidatus Zixiibacteriota bacterium]|nr:MAG: lamin tail domain-containing protein [candidate division Zixibacteria bacterium]